MNLQLFFWMPAYRIKELYNSWESSKHEKVELEQFVGKEFQIGYESGL